MNDKNKPNETPPQAEKEKPEAPDGDGKKAKEESPFGPDIEVVMHIIYNKKLDDFGVISGVKGYLDHKWMAYGTLKAAEKCLDEFYSKKMDARAKFLMGVSTFASKMNMRNFLKRKKF